MHLPDSATASVAFLCIRASCYYWPSFLLFHEYLDVFPAYLADDDMLGCGDAGSAAVGFFCANQLAVNGIELHLRAIAKTADGNDTAPGSYYHTMASLPH